MHFYPNGYDNRDIYYVYVYIVIRIRGRIFKSSMWIESFTNLLNISTQFGTPNTLNNAELFSITYASLFMKVKWSVCASALSKSACVISTGQSKVTIDICISGGCIICMAKYLVGKVGSGEVGPRQVLD